MSRVRTGHKPDDWQDEAPSSALIRHRTYSAVQVTTGPAMQPILTNGGNYLGGREAWKLPALRVEPKR